MTKTFIICYGYLLFNTLGSSSLMLHKTKGIVLRQVQYGETSCIITVFTELFGIQSYIVNGVRTHSKTGNKAVYFQPACILDLVVYHNTLKNLQRIKEFKFFYLYTSILNNVYKNAVALYMIELLHKCLKQPESNAVLYHNIEKAFLDLDKANATQTANYSLYYTMALANWLGFGLNGAYAKQTSVIDLLEGKFTQNIPTHGHYIEEELSSITYQLLQATSLDDIGAVQLSKSKRQELLQAYEAFFVYHISDFTTLRSLPVLYTLFG